MRTPQEVERGLSAPDTLGLESRVEIRKAAMQLLEAMPEGTGRLVIDLAPGTWIPRDSVRSC